MKPVLFKVTYSRQTGGIRLERMEFAVGDENGVWKGKGEVKRGDHYDTGFFSNQSGPRKLVANVLRSFSSGSFQPLPLSGFQGTPASVHEIFARDRMVETFGRRVKEVFECGKPKLLDEADGKVKPCYQFCLGPWWGHKETVFVIQEAIGEGEDVPSTKMHFDKYLELAELLDPTSPAEAVANRKEFERTFAKQIGQLREALAEHSELSNRLAEDHELEECDDLASELAYRIHGNFEPWLFRGLKKAAKGAGIDEDAILQIAAQTAFLAMGSDYANELRGNYDKTENSLGGREGARSRSRFFFQIPRNASNAIENLIKCWVSGSETFEMGGSQGIKAVEEMGPEKLMTLLQLKEKLYAKYGIPVDRPDRDVILQGRLKADFESIEPLHVVIAEDEELRERIMDDPCLAWLFILFGSKSQQLHPKDDNGSYTVTVETLLKKFFGES